MDYPGFLTRFRDPIRVPRIEKGVPRIRENYHRVSRIRESRVPRIREIGSLQIHTGYLTFSLKKKRITYQIYLLLSKIYYKVKWLGCELLCYFLCGALQC